MTDSDNSAEVTYLALYEQHAKLAAGYNDGSVRIWNLSDHSCTVTLRGHGSPISYMAFDKEGVRLASGSRDGDIVIWDLVSELGLCRLRGHKESISGFHFFSSAPNMAISGSKDTLLKVWDLSLKHCVETIVDHRFEVGSFDLTPDEQYLISGSMDAAIRLFAIHAAHLQKSLQLEKHEKMVTLYATVERKGKEKVQSLQIHPSGQLFTLQSFDKAVEVYKIFTPDEMRKLESRRKKRQKEKLAKLADEPPLPADESSVLVKPGDEIKYLTSVRVSSKVRSSFFGSAIDVKNRTVQIVIASFQNSVESYQVSLDTAVEPLLQHALEQQGHRSEVRFVAMDAQSSLILSGSQEQLKLWNSVSGACIRSIDPFESGAVCGLFDPSGRFALVGHKDGCLAVFELGSGACVQHIPNAHAGTLWSMALRPDGTALMTGGADKEVRFWSLSTPPSTASLQLTHTRTLRMTDDVLCVRYSPDARLIALSLLDCTIKVFYEDTVAFFLSLYGHKLPVLSLDISSDSQLLISGSSDKNVKIWGLDFGDCHRSLFSHDQAVTSVAFVPKTHYFFTASKDRALKFWDGDKFIQVMKLKGHMGEVHDLAISKNGTAIVSVSADRSIRIWTRTEEQVFVDEEKEKEMEELMDAQLLGEDPRNKLQDDLTDDFQTDLTGTVNLENIKASEKLFEVIELATEEISQLKEYEERKLQASLPLDRPSRHSLLLGYARGNHELPAQWIVLMLAERIPASELEQCLLVLPLHAVISLLSMIGYWIQKASLTPCMT